MTQGLGGYWLAPHNRVSLGQSDLLRLHEEGKRTLVAEVDRVAHRLGEPTAFYLGKLQDGLTLDPLTGYSRQIIPFFADHPTARLTLLTKSADVSNLVDLDHREHAILSWTG